MHLEEASSIMSDVLTPFLRNAASAIKAGNLQAFLSQSEQCCESLSTTLLKLRVMLSASSAWFASNNSAIYNASRSRLLTAHGVMLDACFAATTALSNSKQSVNLSHLSMLSAAFKIMHAWKAAWPLQHLLNNRHRLAALDQLLAGVVKLYNEPIVHSWELADSQLISDVVMFSDIFLKAICVLPSHEIPHTLDTLPPTLLAHLLVFVDNQLHRLAQSPTSGCIHNIAASLETLTSSPSASSVFTPALDNFAKHLLVTSVEGNLTLHDLKKPGKVKSVDKAAIVLLFRAALLVSQPSAYTSGLRQTQSTSSLVLQLKPIVSNQEYFQALCLHSSPCTVDGFDHYSVLSGMLVLNEMTSTHNDAGGIMLEESHQDQILSLLRFLGRKAQSCILPVCTASTLGDHSCISFQLQDRGESSETSVQILLRESCRIVTAITGTSS